MTNKKDNRKDIRKQLTTIGYRFIYKASEKTVYAIRDEKLTDDTWVDKFILARGEKAPIPENIWIDMCTNV